MTYKKTGTMKLKSLMQAVSQKTVKSVRGRTYKGYSQPDSEAFLDSNNGYGCSDDLSDSDREPDSSSDSSSDSDSDNERGTANKRAGHKKKFTASKLRSTINSLSSRNLFQQGSADKDDTDQEEGNETGDKENKPSRGNTTTKRKNKIKSTINSLSKRNLFQQVAKDKDATEKVDNEDEDEEGNDNEETGKEEINRKRKNKSKRNLKLKATKLKSTINSLSKRNLFQQGADNKDDTDQNEDIEDDEDGKNETGEKENGPKEKNKSKRNLKLKATKLKSTINSLSSRNLFQQVADDKDETEQEVKIEDDEEGKVENGEKENGPKRKNKSKRNLKLKATKLKSTINSLSSRNLFQQVADNKDETDQEVKIEDDEEGKDKNGEKENGPKRKNKSKRNMKLKAAKLKSTIISLSNRNLFNQVADDGGEKKVEDDDDDEKGDTEGTDKIKLYFEQQKQRQQERKKEGEEEKEVEEEEEVDTNRRSTESLLADTEAWCTLDEPNKRPESQSDNDVESNNKTNRKKKTKRTSGTRDNKKDNNEKKKKHRSKKGKESLKSKKKKKDNKQEEKLSDDEDVRHDEDVELRCNDEDPETDDNKTSNIKDAIDDPFEDEDEEEEEEDKPEDSESCSHLDNQHDLNIEAPADQSTAIQEGSADETTTATNISNGRQERRRSYSMRNLSKSSTTSAASVLPMLSQQETRALMDKKKRAISLQTPKEAAQRKLDRQAARDSIRGNSEHEISLIPETSSKSKSERVLLPGSRSNRNFGTKNGSRKKILQSSSSLRSVRGSGAGERQRRRTSARGSALLSVVEDHHKTTENKVRTGAVGERQRRRTSLQGSHHINDKKQSENKSRRNSHSHRRDRTTGPRLKRSDSGSSDSSHDSLKKNETVPASKRTILRSSSFNAAINSRPRVKGTNSVQFAPTVSIKQF
jgi:hypothetical protein